MYQTRTTFVIGAGASAAFGFPTGPALAERIVEILDWQNNSSAAALLRANLARLAHERGGNVDQFAAAAKEIRRKLTFFPSIDNCLHSMADNPTAVTLGKLAIAQIILKAEHDSKLYGRQGMAPDLAQEALRKTYLGGLVEQLVTEAGSFGDGLFENVSFIIFNYDRVVEEYLFQALPYAFPSVPAERVAEALSKVPMIHPYGSLGRLPWQVRDTSGTPRVPFGCPDTLNRVDGIATGIKTFTERNHAQVFLDRLKAAYRDADRVVFLGFAFYGLNMELLASHDDVGPPDGWQPRQVYGTVYKEPVEVLDTFKIAVAKTFGPHRSAGVIDLADLDCKTFMERYRRILTS